MGSLSGSLRDFQAGDIFQLIGSQQKTGTLVIRRKDQNAHIYFRAGKVCRAEPIWPDHPSPLGNLLVEAEVITHEQFETALAKHDKTLRAIEDILLEDDAIIADVLSEFIRLQTTETIYNLFLWRSGEYEFVAGEVPEGTGWNETIDAENILMEGMRMVDEWPVVRNVIPSNQVTFVTLRTADGRPLGDEAALPPVTGGLSRIERQLYALVRSSRTVAKLAALSRMGEFETSRALAHMTQNGFLRVVKSSGKGRVAGQFMARSGQLLINAIAQSAFALLLLSVVAFAAVIIHDVLLDQPLGPAAGPQNDAFLNPIADLQLQRLHRAVQMFKLREGRLPDTLKELVKEDFLRDGDLQYPFREPYLYRVDAGEYRLYAPWR